MAKTLTPAYGKKVWNKHIVPDAHAPKPAKAKGFREDISKYQPFFDRWQNGEPIINLAKESGLKRSKFRRVMQALSGGKEAYKAKRDEGAGGKKVATRAQTNGTSRINDGGVPMTASCCKSDGWRVEHVWRPTTVEVKIDGHKERVPYREKVGTIYTDPEGQRYVRSADNEKADLIRLSDTAGIPNVRLRYFEDSAVARYLESVMTEMERGEAALLRIQQAKRVKREARKAKKAAKPRRK